jgi:DNA-binding transcriptional LysR family regulator
VTVSVLVGSRDVTLPALLQGELDLVITDPSIAADGGLSHEPLYDDNVLVTSALDHPLAARGKLTLADLVGERWALSNSRTHGQLCEIFRKCGLPLPRVALLTNSSWLRLRAVAMSRLLGTFAVPASFAFAEAHSQLQLLPVEDLVWKRSFCVAYRSSAYLSPAVRRLIDELKTVAQARREVPAGIATEIMI